MRDWLTSYDRNGGLFGHLNWHLGLFELHAGNLGAGLQLYNDSFCTEDHRGAVHQKLGWPISLRVDHPCSGACLRGLPAGVIMRRLST
jgi:hypothetical protein